MSLKVSIRLFPLSHFCCWVFLNCLSACTDVANIVIGGYHKSFFAHFSWSLWAFVLDALNNPLCFFVLPEIANDIQAINRFLLLNMPSGFSTLLVKKYYRFIRTCWGWFLLGVFLVFGYACFLIAFNQLQYESVLDGHEFFKPESIDVNKASRFPIWYFLECCSKCVQVYVHLRVFFMFFRFFFQVIYPFRNSVILFPCTYFTPKCFRFFCLWLLICLSVLSTNPLVDFSFVILQYPVLCVFFDTVQVPFKSFFFRQKLFTYSFQLCHQTCLRLSFWGLFFPLGPCMVSLPE